ncbi:MAG: hypothetical protein H6624_05000 [Bdellovibrionaceae bacterium]|nr:hypothetical protein [Bdellovibrionales bacterium]MCB9083676.1 hypothetical protein [Pseudobdellovibrionaceae bacterium]
MMMEEGSFQPQITYDFVGDENQKHRSEDKASLTAEEVTKVPIPTELPHRPDLSALPEHIQRSAAVESLLQQNEDLMARLAVAIRRSSLIEEKLGKYEAAVQQLKDRNEVLADQLLVFREKDRVQGLSRSQYEKQIREYKEKVALLEVQYAEYFATSKERQRRLSSSVDQLSRRLGRYLRYRSQMQRATKKMRRELREQVQGLTTENEVLLQRLQQEEDRLFTLREKLSETVDHIQRQAQESEANQRQLVESYEAQFGQLKEQLKENQDRVLDLEGQLKDYEALYEEKISLENKLVAANRAVETTENGFNEEVRRLQVELADFRREAKEKSLEVARLTDQNLQEIAELEDLRLAKSRLEDQVESLQCLWRDANNQLEIQSEKNRSLQKLNQQLSTSLNERRKEVEALRGQMDSHGFRASDKIRELEGQVKTLAETNVKLQEDQDSSREKDLHARREAISRIENLIAEIQSGFSMKAGEDSAPECADVPPELPSGPPSL